MMETPEPQWREWDSSLPTFKSKPYVLYLLLVRFLCKFLPINMLYNRVVAASDFAVILSFYYLQLCKNTDFDLRLFSCVDIRVDRRALGIFLLLVQAETVLTSGAVHIVSLLRILSKYSRGSSVHTFTPSPYRYSSSWAVAKIV